MNIMRVVVRWAGIVLLLMAMPIAAVAAPPPRVENANNGIFEAFKTHSVVAIAEWHGLAQELDYYGVLIRDPRFAREVGNIVLETGDAAQQGVVDRYVNGEPVSYAELRKVWSDTVGWYPTVSYIGSQNVYAAIRAVNLKLPADQRIKVWLGEPPIEWSKVQTRDDWKPLDDQRETFPARLIETEIIDKKEKALVIYGAGHLGIYPGYDNIRAQLDSAHFGALFVVSPYVGYAQADCAKRFEKHLKGWGAPSLAWPIRGSSLEKDIYRDGCGAFARPPTLAESQYELANRNNLGATSDALLYLGPRERQVFSSDSPDLYMDMDYRAELQRRYQIRTGQPMAETNLENHPSVPRPFWPN